MDYDLVREHARDRGPLEMLGRRRVREAFGVGVPEIAVAEIPSGVPSASIVVVFRPMGNGPPSPAIVASHREIRIRSRMVRSSAWTSTGAFSPKSSRMGLPIACAGSNPSMRPAAGLANASAPLCSTVKMPLRMVRSTSSACSRTRSSWASSWSACPAPASRIGRPRAPCRAQRGQYRDLKPYARATCSRGSRRRRRCTARASCTNSPLPRAHEGRIGDDEDVERREGRARPAGDVYGGGDENEVEQSLQIEEWAARPLGPRQLEPGRADGEDHGANEH